MSMKVIITGGAGFIGCHAAAALREQGCDVIIVDNLSRPGVQHNLDWLKSLGIAEFHRLDVRDAESILDLVARHRDAGAVLHLAGQVAVTRSVVNPRDDFENNALGTLNVLEAVRIAAAGRPAVIYSSTNKIYGGLEHLESAREGDRHILPDRPLGIDENEPLNFHSPYGCSKGAGDQYVRDYARIYGMRTVAFVQSCVYGTRQYGLEDQGWVAHFVIAAQLGKPVTIYGDGRQVRDLIWIDDVVRAYQSAIQNMDDPHVRGHGFNLGGGPDRALSLRELTAFLERRLGHELDIREADWRPGDQRVFIADTRKAQSALGWRPTVSVEEGLDRLWDWVAEHLDELRALPKWQS